MRVLVPRAWNLPVQLADDMTQAVDLLLARDVAVGAAGELDVLLAPHHVPDRLGFGARLVPDIDREDQRVAARLVVEHRLDGRVRIDAAVPVRLAIDAHGAEGRR